MIDMYEYYTFREQSSLSRILAGFYGTGVDYFALLEDNLHILKTINRRPYQITVDHRGRMKIFETFQHLVHKNLY